MKKLTMVLPLALLLAYCSGPNNTQTTNTDTNTDATASTTTTTVSDDMATTSTDVGDVNTNTTTIHSDRTMGDVSVDHSTSVINPLPADTTDPMYQHWQRTNGQYWTWDLNYPGYDRPTAYNSAINGDWQLVMTPELVTAWRADDSRTLWLRNGSTYLSASETFNTRNNLNGVNAGVNTNVNTGTLNGNTTVNGTTGNSNVNGAATLNGQYSSTYDPQSETYMGNKQGSVKVNGSTSAGTVSSNNSSSSTSGLNNNASANANTANRMNGSSTTTTSPVTSSTNPGVNISANSNSTSATNGLGSTQVNGSASGTLNTQGNVSAGVNGNVNSTTDVNGTMGTMDVNSINYNAYNGNMYQVPKFNLYLDNGSFTGYTGCNGISGRVEVTGNSLHFLNTTPSTAIDCMGGFDEKVLVDMLKRIDSYAYVGNELQLMQGSQVLLRFKRNSQDTMLK
jgi:heat shock protein HslJ